MLKATDSQNAIEFFYISLKHKEIYCRMNLKGVSGCKDIAKIELCTSQNSNSESYSTLTNVRATKERYNLKEVIYIIIYQD